MSLKAVHAGLVWTAFVLIVALLIYYFHNEYVLKHYPSRSQSRTYPRQPTRRPMMHQPYYQPRIKDNRKLDIVILVCCYVLPFIITDSMIPIGFALTGHLSIAGIIKTIVAFICAGVLLYFSHYVHLRGFRINSIILKVYSAVVAIYGIYIGYNIVVAFYNLYQLRHLLG